MKICIKKNELSLLLFFILVFLIISGEGILKYIALSGIIVICLIKRKFLNMKYFNIVIPSLIYIFIGSIVAFLSGTFTFFGVKQLLIYLCSGLFSIVLFSLYGKKETIRLLDIQFIALCIAYLMLYARYFTLTEFYYESNIYAYIFGAYALIYFCQNRKVMMIFAIIFMLFDHKRIADAAFVIALIALFIIKIFRKNKHQKWIKSVSTIVLIALPIGWVLMCSNGMLANIFMSLGINTMGRLEGTGAWNLAKRYYDISPLFMGNGIGFVTEWLGRGNVFSFSNLHNDFLTGYIELGFIGFFIWIITFQIPLFGNKKQPLIKLNIISVLIGFMFLNFLTDNIYLYVTFLAPFYLILLSILYGDDSDVYINNFRSRLACKNN